MRTNICDCNNIDIDNIYNNIYFNIYGLILIITNIYKFAIYNSIQIQKRGKDESKKVWEKRKDERASIRINR